MQLRVVDCSTKIIIFKQITTKRISENIIDELLIVVQR